MDTTLDTSLPEDTPHRVYFRGSSPDDESFFTKLHTRARRTVYVGGKLFYADYYPEMVPVTELKKKLREWAITEEL